MQMAISLKQQMRSISAKDRQGKFRHLAVRPNVAIPEPLDAVFHRYIGGDKSILLLFWWDLENVSFISSGWKIIRSI